MIRGFFEESIVKRAIDKKLIQIEFINPRDFALGAHKSVDDKPYGGGAGMVLKVDVLSRALSRFKVKSSKCKVVLTSAKGKSFNQRKAQEYAKLDHLILIAGHYEAVDERILDMVDEEISLGDFVMTGGEITGAAIVDSIVRLIPGVLKKEEAIEHESFRIYPIKHLIEELGRHPVLAALEKKDIKDIQLLEHPHYTRPEEFEGKKVPEILLSGNHAEIEKWKLRKSFEETLKKRPDLLSD